MSEAELPPQEELPAHALALAEKGEAGALEALARLGGPFLSFYEYVTLEEAQQRLGMLVVGGGALAEPFDLELDFALKREGDAPRRAQILRRGVQGDVIIDAPFAYEGGLAALEWRCEARLTWRGVTLRRSFASTRLFPTISNWQVLYFNPAENMLDLEDILREDGELAPGLPWEPRWPDPEKLAQLSEPYAVFFVRERAADLEAGTPVAAWLAATLESPGEREALLAFQGGGEYEFFLNGELILEQPQIANLEAYAHQTLPWLDPPQVLPLRLKPGKNVLAVRSQPGKNRYAWFFGAALLSA
jgi:hypothetical protein